MYLATHVVQVRELYYNRSRQGSRGGLYGHRQNLGVEDCAVPTREEETRLSDVT